MSPEGGSRGSVSVPLSAFHSSSSLAESVKSMSLSSPSLSSLLLPPSAVDFDFLGPYLGWKGRRFLLALLCQNKIAEVGSNCLQSGVCMTTLTRLVRVSVFSLFLQSVLTFFIILNPLSHSTEWAGMVSRRSMIAIKFGYASPYFNPMSTQLALFTGTKLQKINHKMY